MGRSHFSLEVSARSDRTISRPEILYSAAWYRCMPLAGRTDATFVEHQRGRWGQRPEGKTSADATLSGSSSTQTW